jgi:hypothetical protein
LSNCFNAMNASKHTKWVFGEAIQFYILDCCSVFLPRRYSNKEHESFMVCFAFFVKNQVHFCKGNTQYEIIYFAWKVMVCHFVSDSPQVMTAFIVVLPIIVVVEIFLQLHQPSSSFVWK